MTCGCRRCRIDRYNRHMAGGGRSYVPSDIYRCDQCRQLTCERAEDHRRECIKVRLARARNAYYANGEDMNYDD